MYVLCIMFRKPNPTCNSSVGYSSSHTIQKSKNMNRAKYVSIFLLCVSNNVVVEYSVVDIKACTGVLALLRAGNNMLQGITFPCLIRSSPYKDIWTEFFFKSKIFY